MVNLKYNVNCSRLDKRIKAKIIINVLFCKGIRKNLIVLKGESEM